MSSTLPNGLQAKNSLAVQKLLQNSPFLNRIGHVKLNSPKSILQLLRKRGKTELSPHLKKIVVLRADQSSSRNWVKAEVCLHLLHCTAII